VARQEHVYREHLTHLTVYRRSLEPVTTEERLLNSLAADAALFHAEAHLKWLEHCRATLQGWQPVPNDDNPAATSAPAFAPELRTDVVKSGAPKLRTHRAK
jgi:hypothetical protein